MAGEERPTEGAEEAGEGECGCGCGAGGGGGVGFGPCGAAP